jgi:hypothetical protein
MAVDGDVRELGRAARGDAAEDGVERQAGGQARGLLGSVLVPDGQPRFCRRIVDVVDAGHGVGEQGVGRAVLLTQDHGGDGGQQCDHQSGDDSVDAEPERRAADQRGVTTALRTPSAVRTRVRPQPAGRRHSLPS